MEGRYNMRSPAVKRLMKEAQELREPTEQYFAEPLEDNLFEWHFTIRGPSDSEFEGGTYHGRIILPPDYPMKPPSIMLLTPNGRFEILKKICLSISGHHPESWQPSWSIRTALLAIIGFMPTHGSGAIGSLDYSAEERKVLAKKSQDWKCPTCGNVNNILKPVTEASEKTKQEAKELASQINFQGEKEKKEEASSAAGSESGASSGVTSEATPSPAGASATSSPAPHSPQMFPWPGMPPFMPRSANGQQFQRFPFPPPFPMSPNWQQRFQMLRFPPSPMSQRYPGPFPPPNFMQWFAQGQTHTTNSRTRPVMSETQQASNASRPQSTTPTAPSPRPQSTPSPPATSESQTPQPAAPTTAADATQGLRQRQTQTAASPPAAAEPAPTFDIPREQPNQGGGIISSGLMLILGLAILLLLVRRLYMLDVFK